MTQRITAQISDDEAAALDEAVASGRFPSRAAAVRAAIALLAEEPEVVEGELVVPEPPALPVAASPVELARRALVPLVSAGAVGLAAGLARRRTRLPAGPVGPADTLIMRRVEEVWLRRR
jgi:Arc/MetJ-type ribon-helix-helix transcriptional regulator